MNKRWTVILLILLSFSFRSAMASHIVGGEFTYKYLGDTTIFYGPPVNAFVTVSKYRVSLSIYQDCITGQVDAIAQDNPAYFSLFENEPGTRPVDIDTGIFVDIRDPQAAITVPANFSNECVTNIPGLCLLRKTFNKMYYLPPNATGYRVVYQRCCRNASIINIKDPGDKGATYSCSIPPRLNNSSAVFNNYPPQIICLNNPLYYDHSASDPDGDSLSYEFCPAQLATGADIKPIVIDTDQVYPNVEYVTPPYSYGTPMTGFPPIQIDPANGLMTGTPNRIGRYLVTVCCHEWRHGVMINTVKREFQFVVTDCSKVVVADIPQFSTAPNTYIVNCKDYKVHFVNTSKGGFNYRWDLGVAGTAGDESTAFEPDYVYPDTGTYAVKLVVNPGTTCPDSITRLVKIYPQFRAAFVDSGSLCPGTPIFFTDSSVASIKPITSWNWSFGDGANATDQNPSHTYLQGGTYNVILISQNIKDCVDTALKRLVIQDFKPYAGDDTVIVKGEQVAFNAHGGIRYQWMPAVDLNDVSGPNPVGTYPDTGTYTYRVYVESAYGCKGFDTIQVLVVNQASFFVPTAFTPNGDGRNDIFRPMAVGYRNLKYFKVYNRFGEEVYSGETLEDGWDGTYKGQPAEMGVYFWQIVFIDRFGKDGSMKGDVTLVR